MSFGLKAKSFAVTVAPEADAARPPGPPLSVLAPAEAVGPAAAVVAVVAVSLLLEQALSSTSAGRASKASNCVARERDRH
jgi:hypothetical protein